MNIPEIKSIPDYAFDALRDEIRRFQVNIPQESEIGIIANGGGTMIHIESFSMRGQMIVFDGVDADGRTARLIQHYTQVNVQLVAVQKLQEQPRRIGF